MLQDIYDQHPLTVSEGKLINMLTKKTYPITTDFATTIDNEKINGGNKEFQTFYNHSSIHGTYDFGEKLIDKFFWGSQLKKARQEIIALLDVKPNTSVLSVSIGTGRDFEFFPKEILPTLHIAGLDISAGMLKQANKKFKKWKIDIDLFLGNAETLPFADNSFDTVFHFGGINFFNSPSQAVAELYRVAKPGTKIMFGDETEAFIKKNYKKMPVVKNIIKDKEISLKPLNWLPQAAKAATYQEFGKGKMYAVTFIKE